MEKYFIALDKMSIDEIKLIKELLNVTYDELLS